MIDPQDRAEFAEAMHALGHTFNEPVSTIRTEAYFDALADFTIEQVNAAARLAIRSSRFFPKPIELREFIEGTPDGHADDAWAALIEQIRRVGYIGTPTFTDERTLRAINETWGSWRRLCETLPGEGPELIGWMKQFKAAFQSLEKRETQRLEPGTLHPKIREFIQQKQKALR